MSEIFPISCISCRRKKIKCNKVKPCNQCEKRQIRCNFPSTFRNIRIDEEELETSCSYDSTENKDEENSCDLDLKGSRSPGRQSSKRILETLKTENPTLADEHLKLKNKYQDLLTQFTMYCKANNCSDKLPEPSKEKDIMPINRETTELGAKYYGPLSSSYILKNMGVDEKSDVKMAANKNKSAYSPLQTPASSDLGRSPTQSTFESNQDLIKNSLLKKPLPYLLGLDFIIGSRNLSKTNVDELNFNIICKLVDFFFSYHPVYKTFISKQQIVDFLNNYYNMNENEWENDDDFLLLLMILLLLIQRLTAKEFIDINLLDNVESQTIKFKKVKDHLTDILYHKFEKIRHNLINETVATVQSYILCTEWHFIEQRFEESWSMMFHTCSISYSIGLHVMGKFGIMDKKDLKEKDEEIGRYRIWYALKNISGQISSILGRPSPISLHVNSLMLTASTPTYSLLEIEKDKMLVSLKVGLSECLKLSNTMLIENFMTDFSIDELLRLDSKFKKEIDQINVLINDKLYDKNLFDYLNTDPMDEDFNDDKTENQWFLMDNGTLLVDLITFYINRAKLLQPFILKFQDSNDNTAVIELLQETINQFLDYLIYFVNSFLNQLDLQHKETNFRYLKTETFSKILRSHYPFLNSFIYQGMLVIFTILHYKFKDFIECEDNGRKNIDYSEFLNKLGEDLNTLLKLESNFAGMTCNHNKLWSSNITYLIHLDIAHIEKIRIKQITKIRMDHKKFQNEVNELQNQINFGFNPESELHGLNIHDPFWITCPDSLPYHLASPTDEYRPSKSTFENLVPERAALSSYPEHSRQPQLLRTSQVSSNILVDDFKPQGNARFGDVWSNNS
ncbi:unnamed protein product [Debaryomyces tyrocola]|nr:unnamed protein product [Debaryomyces tyrocola]